MKKRTLLWAVWLLLSCAEKVVQKPEDLIPKDTMVQILHDLAVLNAATASPNMAPERYGLETMDFLYQKYQIDSTQLVQSDRYYASQPLEYQSIYEAVKEQLGKTKETLEDAEDRKNDL